MNANQILQDFYQILNDYNIEYCKVNNRQLFKDLFPLEEAVRLCSKNSDLWEYEISRTSILLPYVPSHTFPESETVEIVLWTNVKIFERTTSTIEDPLSFLELNIEMKSVRGTEKALAAWHLDKHSQIGQPDDGEGKYLHPEYHFTFGGRIIEEALNSGWDLGKILIMRSPRLMHPPMEVVLGVNFVLEHFIPREYIGDLLDSPRYSNLIKQTKKHIWKPYALAFAHSLCDNWANDTSGLTFNQTFCKSIVG